MESAKNHPRQWTIQWDVVLDFLYCLFAQGFTDTWKTCRPNNTSVFEEGTQTLAESFPDAWVRFFRFIRAGDASAMTTEMARITLARGAAVIGWVNQAQVDVLIPVVINKEGELGDTNVTVILVPLRVRRQFGTIWIDAKDLGVFPTLENGRIRVDGHPGPKSAEDAAAFPNGWPHDLKLAPKLTMEAAKESLPRPYTTLLMELGGREHPDQSPTSSSTHSVAAIRSNERRSQRNITEGLVPKHRKYSLPARGCSAATYRCVNQADHPSLSMLLRLSDVLHEIPRDALLRHTCNAPVLGNR